MQAAGAVLLNRIGEPVLLIAHSHWGLIPWLITNVRPNLTRAIVAIEPSGPSFQETIFGNASARPYGLGDIP